MKPEKLFLMQASNSLKLISELLQNPWVPDFDAFWANSKLLLDKPGMISK